MSVFLGKIAWLLFSPGSLIFGLLVLGLLLSWIRRTRRLGIACGAVALALTMAAAILPVRDLLVRPLEEYFPVSDLPERIDGILVLGGAEEPAIAAARGQPELNGSADRLIAFVALARRYPEARLVFAGGGYPQWPADQSEAAIARRIFAIMGLDDSRVLFDARSRNTIENALYARDLARPQAGETWLLVTSARHMPRAVNCFDAIDWPVLPYPVDFSTGVAAATGEFAPLGGLSGLNGASREWLGLIAYRLLGHTQRLLPARDSVRP